MHIYNSNQILIVQNLKQSNHSLNFVLLSPFFIRSISLLFHIHIKVRWIICIAIFLKKIMKNCSVVVKIIFVNYKLALTYGKSKFDSIIIK